MHDFQIIAILLLHYDMIIDNYHILQFKNSQIVDPDIKVQYKRFTHK
jgi:hypothetical protein